MALLPYALISLDEAKDALKISGSSMDDAVTAAINAATEAIEGFCRNNLVQRSFDEFYRGGVNGRNGGAKRLFLRHYPIVSVTSITDDAETTVEAIDYTIWPAEGILEHVYRWLAPLKERGGVGRWRIVYVAGRFANTAAVAADLKKATIQLLRYWRVKIPGVDSKRVGDFSVTFATGAGGGGGSGGGGGAPSLPDDVVVLLQRYVSRTGG